MIHSLNVSSDFSECIFKRAHTHTTFTQPNGAVDVAQLKTTERTVPNRGIFSSGFVNLFVSNAQTDVVTRGVCLSESGFQKHFSSGGF